MTVGDRVSALVEDVEIDALAQWLLVASVDERAEARRWLHEHGEDLLWNRGDRRDYSEVGVRRTQRQPWFVALLTVALEPPVAAAGSHALSRVNRTSVLQGPDLLLRVVRSRDERWVREFVPAAAVRQANSEIHFLLAALVTERGLPFPEGEAFVGGWVVSLRFTDVATMTEQMLADPLAAQLVHAYLASSHVSADPPVLAAAVPLVAAGLLDRDQLVSEGIERLTALPRVGTQRPIAAMLASLDLRLEDLPGGVPFAQGLVATCHGTVGAVLLPLLLLALATPDELRELTTTIAGRPERAQRTVLLKALAGKQMQERLGTPAVLEALGILRETGDDEKLLRQVDTVASRLGVAPAVAQPAAPEPRGLWGVVPAGEPTPAKSLQEFSHLQDWMARGVAYELHDAGPSIHGGSTLNPDLYLGAFVGHAASEGAGPVRDWLVRNVEAYLESPGMLGEAIADWVADPGLESFRAACARAGEERRDTELRRARPYALNSPGPAFRYLLAREALLRLGTTPCLLSTPSHDDHTLTFEALAERVARCQGSTVGRLDLLQALLRLRPTSPEALSALDGMALPIDAQVVGGRDAQGATDAADLIRAWVRGGGLPALAWHVEPGEWQYTRWVADVDLGVLTELAASAPLGFVDCLPGRTGGREIGRIVPQWRDLQGLPYRALDRPDAMGGTSGLADLALKGEWPIDLPLHDVLLARMGSSDRRRRVASARIVLELVGQQRFDADRFTKVALMRLDAGVLVLPRVVAVWDLVTQAGGLRALWPVMCEVADAACSLSPVPPGMPDLLRLMTSLLPEVPAPEVSVGVRRYAARRGSTKAQFEARRLVATADGPASS